MGFALWSAPTIIGEYVCTALRYIEAEGVLSILWCGNWPIEPRYYSHPVGTTAGEFQNFGIPRFHAGLDILGAPEPNGPFVRTKEGGTVLQPPSEGCGRDCTLTLILGSQNEINHAYSHLEWTSIPRLVKDADVGVTFIPANFPIGQLAQWVDDDGNQLPCKFHHLHFQTCDQTGCAEPLLDLNPKETNNGVVLQVEFIPNDDPQNFGFAVHDPYAQQHLVGGQVDIVAVAHDWGPDDQKTGILRLSYEILNDVEFPFAAHFLAFNSLVKSTIDFSKIGSDVDNRTEILFRESTSNYCSDPPGEHFSYVMTNVRCEKGSECNTRLDDPVDTNFSKHFAWDTTQFPNGNYRVTVAAWDFANNRTSKTEFVKIVNKQTN